MSDPFVRFIQQRLIAHGIKVTDDGIAGAETRTALAVFQRAAGLKETATANPQTVAELMKGNERVTPPASPATPVGYRVRPVWLAAMEAHKGLHEVRDKSRLMDWLRKAPKILGDPAELPWCGAAVLAAITTTLPGEVVPSAPFLARNWLAFGEKTVPRLGAVLVFWRGRRDGPSGHVGLYVGEDATTYHVLGGNQSDAITVTRIAKSRLLGARWPTNDRTQTTAIERVLAGPISTNEA